MKYNLDEIEQCTEAFEYLTKLVGQHALVEITKKSRERSLNQNSYLHILITAFADHFGYTVEEAKVIYKQANRDIYYYKKNNIGFWRSSADLTKDEMTRSIDKFRWFSAEHGCELPMAVDADWLMRIENDHERLKDQNLT